MRLESLPGARLGYCLNVHAGRTLQDVRRAIAHHAGDVRRLVMERCGGVQSLGVGLWLNHEAALEVDQGDNIARLDGLLGENGLHVRTMNGFPFGAFHGTRVKEGVYRPDWSDPLRYEHTVRLAMILAQLVPEGECGTISTLPITYRAWADKPVVLAAREQLARLAVRLDRIYQETGRLIRLAIEPEPDCLLDDTPSVLAFWRETRAVLLSSEAEAWERHIGLCLDTAHAATLFEPLEDVLAALATERIPVHKIQIAAVPEVSPEENAVELLEPFRDEIYLHQTCLQMVDGRRLRFADLPEALAMRPGPAQWRTHYHVPLSWRPPGPLRTTASQLTPAFLRAAHAQGVRHFELEVYCLGLMLHGDEAVHAMLAEDLIYLTRMAMGCDSV